MLQLRITVIRNLKFVIRNFLKEVNMFDLKKLKYPVIALSPMDAVSDAPFRYIAKKYGNPDLIFTEFTHVHGLCVAGDNLLHHFNYDQSERPVFAQIFGKEPEYFYHAAKMVCALGFDGVDINMGCPAKTVAQSGSGAALIKTPDLAREIIAAVRKGVQDWVKNGELTGLSDRTMRELERMIKMMNFQLTQVPSSKNSEPKTHNPELSNGYINLLGKERREISVSVKTRIGFDHPVTEEWIKNVASANPDWITVHGRTLKQMYTGEANWDEIRKAVQSTDLPVLANGDIKTKEDVEKVLKLTGAYGVLVGRATYGNPWIFEELRMEGEGKNVGIDEKLKVLLEHTEKFVEVYPEPKIFFQMRKHFGWYCKDFDGASELRSKLIVSSSLEQVREIITQFQKSLQD